MFEQVHLTVSASPTLFTVFGAEAVLMDVDFHPCHNRNGKEAAEWALVLVNNPVPYSLSYQTTSS